jgi:hypothetical protein
MAIKKNITIIYLKLAFRGIKGNKLKIKIKGTNKMILNSKIEHYHGFNHAEILIGFMENI